MYANVRGSTMRTRFDGVVSEAEMLDAYWNRGGRGLVVRGKLLGQ